MKKKDKIIKKMVFGDLLKKNRMLCAVTVIFSFIASFTSVIVVFVLQRIIDSLSKGTTIDDFVKTIIGGLVVILVLTLSTFFKERLRNTYVCRISSQLKKRMFKYMLDKNTVDFEKFNNGEFITMYELDIENIKTKYLINFFAVIDCFIMLVTGCTSMIILSWQLTLVVLVVVVVPMLITVILGKSLPKLELNKSNKNSEFTVHLTDYLNGFRLIKSFSVEKRIQQLFDKYSENYEKSDLKYKNATSYFVSFYELSNYFAMLCLFMGGGILVLKKIVTIGTIMACFELISIITAPMTMFFTNINERRASYAIIEKLYNALFFINEEKNENKKKFQSIDNVEIKNLSFAYSDGRQILYDINFRIEKGKKYALVGNSGSGKSTLFQLLQGFYNDYSGSILINGEELKNIDNSFLNEKIAIMQQNVFIFNATVQENISLFSDVSKNKLDDVINKSGLKDFLDTHGYDYFCGENGKSLSGGEKQRISIARCLLKQFDLLLFDEGTSSLDKITSDEIESTISSLENTCIVITHRLDIELLKKYDSVIVLENGCITESGDVMELLENKGSFYKLYNSMD